MTILTAISKLHAWCDDVKLPWPEDASWRFEKYVTLLEHGQQLTNLTGFSTPETLVEGLFVDSLQILRTGYVRGPLIDVGTGAGFPAIPIKILNPDLDVILVEPRTKRYAFLRMVERELSLSHLTIHKSRIEQVCVPDKLGLAISKAFAPLQDWLEIARPWAEKGADVACLVSVDDWNHVDLKGYHVRHVLEDNKRIYAVVAMF